MYNAINGKLKTLQFGKPLPGELKNGFKVAVINLSVKSDTDVEAAKMLALTGRKGFQNAIRNLNEDRTPYTENILLQKLNTNFTSSDDGYDKVFTPGNPPINVRNFPNQVKEWFNDPAIGDTDRELFSLMVSSFIIYCMPNSFYIT